MSMQTMQMEHGTRANAPARTRYVFAGTTGRDDEAVKVCPRCGEMLFSDMDVCYGCLYDFTRDRHGMARVADEMGRQVLTRPQVVPRTPDLLDGIELDEIDEDEPAAQEPAEREPESVPRHSKAAPPKPLDPGDTLDLSSPLITQALDPVATTPGGAPSSKPCWVILSSSELEARLPIGAEGMTVGRDESNDLVLKDPSVSRRHLRLQCDGLDVTVEDLGATNPAKLSGEPLRGTRAMTRGDTLEICGIGLTLA